MSDTESDTFNVLRFISNALARGGMVGVIIYSVWMAIDHYHYWFSWHIIFCTIGYFPIMAESILLFTGDDSWTQRVSARTEYIIHGVLITVGTISLTAGIVIQIWYTKDAHFATNHGLTGLISMILCWISILIGLATYNSKSLKNFIKPLKLKFIHNIIGNLGYTIGIISLCFAFYTGWWIFYTEEHSRLVIVIVTILTALWTLNGSMTSAERQIKSIFS